MSKSASVPSDPTTSSGTTWEDELRTLEEQGRVAFLAGDVETLDRLWSDDLLVNSPLNVINDKARVLELLRTGRIRHTSNDVEIEQLRRFGDVAIVMGRDCVDGPPNGEVVHRRFTNVWQRQQNRWVMIARHAQAIARLSP